MPRAAILVLVVAAGMARAQPLTVTFRNAASLPNSATDQLGQPFTVAGLSGICQLAPASTIYWAVMDNSNKLIRLDIRTTSDGTITLANLTNATTLSATNDYEGIAMRWGPSLFLAEESTPAIRNGNHSDGMVFGSSQTPAVFSNIRPNFGFESLTLEYAGPYLWTANEEALTVDGPASSSAAGTTVRVTRFTLGGGFILPGPQYAYVTEPWHGSAISNARSGVVDLVALPDGRMLVLERSLAFNLDGFFQSRIYVVDFTGATDISASPGLIGQTYTPVSKQLLYQGDQQNMEGLALGPMIGTGRYALIGIVDDGDPISVNRVVGFQLAGVGPPICYVNCDNSNTPPFLNANDFQCFLNSFAAGESYANCDLSTTPPILNANDFQCYLNYYAAGCPGL